MMAASITAPSDVLESRGTDLINVKCLTALWMSCYELEATDRNDLSLTHTHACIVHTHTQEGKHTCVFCCVGVCVQWMTSQLTGIWNGKWLCLPQQNTEQGFRLYRLFLSAAARMDVHFWDYVWGVFWEFSTIKPFEEIEPKIDELWCFLKARQQVTWVHSSCLDTML